MDTDDNLYVHTNAHSQDEHDDSQPTKPDMNKVIFRSMVPTDGAVSVDILSHISDDYQIVHNMEYEDEQEYNIKCHREGDSGGVSEVRCEQSVKIEDEVQQESKLDIGVRSRSSEDTRHWIVCSGNVLKEVKAEQTVSKSVTSSEDLFEKQQQCRIHNAEETGTNLIYVKSSASGLSLTQSSQREPGEDDNKFDSSCHRRVKTYKCQLYSEVCASQCERNVPEKLLTGVKRFACSTCGKSFARAGHLREHERIHSGVKPFTSTICGKSFSRAGNLREHERIHSGVKPCTCTLCGKAFSLEGKLIRHEILHSSVTPFTCTYCGKSFSLEEKLRRHDILHSGVKPFACTRCGKSFSLKGNLICHERLHSGVKPFPCAFCGKLFSQMGNLRRHERIHSDVTQFTCAQCEK